MCGRMSLFVPQPEIERRFEAHFTDEWTPQFNIAPEEEIPAIRNDSRDEINQLEWELIPEWADDPDNGPRPINARGETVAERPIFRSAFEKRRCLNPADGFYEWKGERGHKQPYRVQRADKEERRDIMSAVDLRDGHCYLNCGYRMVPKPVRCMALSLLCYLGPFDHIDS